MPLRSLQPLPIKLLSSAKNLTKILSSPLVDLPLAQPSCVIESLRKMGIVASRPCLSIPPTTGRCLILEVPTEIRLAIFSYVMNFDHVISLDNYICSHMYKTNIGKLDTSLLFVCRTFKVEASMVLYMNQGFGISERRLFAQTKPNMRDLRYFFLARIGEYNARLIQHLMIETTSIKIMFRELRTHGQTYFSGLEILDIHLTGRSRDEKRKHLFLGAAEVLDTHPKLSRLVLCQSPAHHPQWYTPRVASWRCAFYKDWASDTYMSATHLFRCERYKLVAVRILLETGEVVADVGKLVAKILEQEG